MCRTSSGTRSRSSKATCTRFTRLRAAAHHDLLCIDELGYRELDRHGAGLLFQVLTERVERNSVDIASNESLGGWTESFTGPRLCAALVDRLTFDGTLIEIGTDSYRLAGTRARAEHIEAS
ncbi:ATP-binding protein [Streptomyces mexicanus]|uniref:ATP-binding protein n=1 Tax=Streptomyces mexicanus TaxID=178566 RepID=UPI00365359D4